VVEPPGHSEIVAPEVAHAEAVDSEVKVEGDEHSAKAGSSEEAKP
jgi:hypothetical protein